MKIRRRVGWSGIRNGLFAVFTFVSCSQSGRNQRRRTLRKKTKELLEEYLTRRASILGGDIRPLVTHSSMRKRLLEIVVISEEKEREKEKEKERKEAPACAMCPAMCLVVVVRATMSSLDPKSSLKLIVEAVELARAKVSVVFVSSTTLPKPPRRNPQFADPSLRNQVFLKKETIVVFITHY
ncbi:hypothetical protein ALC60_03134 [Trachymyrmex zeteki]|uniref:Uncharacterized protein n=1 Tax=Mycetomoellerius zeteki TaxID=64791 RepID=A0A151XCI7_9HYME|nr:hypothetical protein ALC60_03134 [Trachymyrmex zeteki]